MSVYPSMTAHISGELIGSSEDVVPADDVAAADTEDSPLLGSRFLGGIGAFGSAPCFSSNVTMLTCSFATASRRAQSPL